MGPWKDWRGNWSCPAFIVPRKKVCDKNRNAPILDQQQRGRMKLSKSILKSSKEKAVQRKTIDNRAAKTLRVTPSSSQVRQMLLWHFSFGEPGQWPPLCRCFWRRLDGLDRQLLTLPRLSIRDLPPRACRGGNTDAALIANPNQYKFCLASLFLFWTVPNLTKGNFSKMYSMQKKSYTFLHYRGFKWARVCGGGLEVDKIVIRNPTLILFAEISFKKFVL